MARNEKIGVDDVEDIERASAQVPWMPTTCGRSVLAAMLGISTRAIGDWADQGVLVRAPDQRGQYLTLPSLRAYSDVMRKRAAARASSSGTSLADERAKLASSQREETDLRIAKLKGEVLMVSEVATAWCDIMMAVKGNVLSLPSKARQQIPHLTAHDATTLKELCRDILRSLSEDVAQGIVGAASGPDAE